MKYKKIIFEKEKISAMAIFSEDIVSELILNIGQNNYDMLNEELTCQLSAYYFQNKKEVRTETVFFKRPTFLEWLLRKPRTAEFTISVKDILKSPMSNRVDRICIVEQIPD